MQVIARKNLRIDETVPEVILNSTIFSEPNQIHCTLLTMATYGSIESNDHNFNMEFRGIK